MNNVGETKFWKSEEFVNSLGKLTDQVSKVRSKMQVSVTENNDPEPKWLLTAIIQIKQQVMSLEINSIILESLTSAIAEVLSEEDLDKVTEVATKLVDNHIARFEELEKSQADRKTNLTYPSKTGNVIV